MRSPHALIPLSGADIFENGSVQQRDEVMPSKRGSYSGVYGVPTSSAPASVSPFHSVAAKFPRLCPPSPPFHSVPPHLLVFSFLPSFLSQQHTGRSAPGHVAAYSHCCLFFTSPLPFLSRELLCLRKLSARVQTPGLIQPGVFRRGQTLRRTSPIYLVFTARFVERPCNAEMLNYPRIVARLLKIFPRGGDCAPIFCPIFARYREIEFEIIIIITMMMIT